MRRLLLILLAVVILGVAISLTTWYASAEGQSILIHVPAGKTLIVTMDNDAVISLDCTLGIKATKANGRSRETITCRPFDVTPEVEMDDREARLWR